MIIHMFILKQLMFPSCENTGSIIESPVKPSERRKDGVNPPSDWPWQGPTEHKE
jgi:hypothetical protein